VLLLLAVLALLTCLAASAWTLKYYLDRDARFRIAGAGNIAASGLTEVSRAEMLPVFGEDIGRNIFFVPLNARRKQLEQLPWVERATVMRLLPDQIRVSLIERQPVAFALLPDGQTGLVDADGILLTMPPAMMAQRHYSFPVVKGIDVSQPLAARKARMAVFQRLLAELDANSQKLSAQVSEIDLTDPADARVLMPEPGGDILAHFGEGQFLERYQRYKAHIADWRQQYPKLASVDLRSDQQVVLEMATGTNVAQTAAEEQNAEAKDDAKPEDAKPAVTKVDAHPGAADAKLKLDKSSAKPPAKAKNAAGRKKTKVQKAATAKVKAMPSTKKRAGAKRAALNVSRQKTAPATLPAIAAGMGQ
jgi:cell division protein FtsQ